METNFTSKEIDFILMKLRDWFILDKIFQMAHITKFRCKEGDRELDWTKKNNIKLTNQRKRREKKNVRTQTVYVYVYLLFSLSRIHFTRDISFVTTNEVNKRNQSVIITEKNDDDDKKNKCNNRWFYQFQYKKVYPPDSLVCDWHDFFRLLLLLLLHTL